MIWGSSLIQPTISLKEKNWFNTGGPAQYFAQPRTAQEFADLIQTASRQNIPVTLLGHGANILISDAGISGLVIQPQITAIEIIDHTPTLVLVRAGAGTSMDALITYCLDHQILGLEEFSGIPGTIGGSVFINLHYFQYLLSDFIVEAQILNKTTGSLETVPKAWFNFGYNYSTLHEQKHFLASATFQLKKASAYETAYAQGRRAEIIRHRAQRYPASNTCGSFFRNFLEHEVTITSHGKKMIYIAYYLDKIGVKGQLRIGDAGVSYQHANMIVNYGNATSADIIELARAMQKMVSEQFGIMPQPECRLLGFSPYPLLS